MKRTWLEWVLAVGVVAVLAGYELSLNPIHFHQTVQADGHTIAVPVFWTPVKSPGDNILVGLRHEWEPFVRAGTVTLMDRSKLDRTDGPWTMTGARRQQVDLVAFQAKDGRFSNPQLMDLNAGKYTGVCEEATTGKNQALICYIVGTPLQFTYLGSRSGEADARRMLASLD
jgi:hypothetical protein